MLFYRILAGGTLLAYSPVALVKAVAGSRRPGDLAGRLGLRPWPDLGGGIWIHAVSVGEVGVAVSILRALERAESGLRTGLSVTTAAGQELARRSAPNGAPVFAFPFDLATPVERALDGVRPGMVLLTETELWPLFIARAARRGIPVLLVNGRISDRSFPRYRMFRRWFSATLRDVSLFLMQTAEDARRIEALGAPPSRVRVAGNVKYDVPPPAEFPDRARLRAAAGARPILVAASTAEAEESFVVDAAKDLAERALLAVAPRRPERFEPVARRLEAAGLSVRKRSATGTGPADVYLLDSIGELAALYGEARVAFVGGSLAPGGGHNPIEAWAAGVPVLVGPHTENFREVTAKGEELGIASRVSEGRKLASAFERALADADALARSGAVARDFVAANRGAADRIASEVLLLAASRAGAPGDRR